MCARNNGFLPKNCESAAERCKSLATESTDPLADYCSAQPLLVERRSKRQCWTCVQAAASTACSFHCRPSLVLIERESITLTTFVYTGDNIAPHTLNLII